MVTSGAPWKERAVVSGTGKWRVADGSAVGGACPASPARARSGRRPRRSRSRAALAGRVARPEAHANQLPARAVLFDRHQDADGAEHPAVRLEVPAVVGTSANHRHPGPPDGEL